MEQIQSLTLDKFCCKLTAKFSSNLNKVLIKNLYELETGYQCSKKVGREGSAGYCQQVEEGRWWTQQQGLSGNLGEVFKGIATLIHNTTYTHMLTQPYTYIHKSLLQDFFLLSSPNIKGGMGG